MALQDIESAVLVDMREGIGSVTLNRPEAINAINDAVRTQLPAAIAAKPPLAARFTKEAALAASTLDLQAGLRLERDLFALLAGTDDHQEALAAFREKRPPRFRNQ